MINDILIGLPIALSARLLSVPLHSQLLISYVLWPVALVMGVEPIDCRRVAELVGLKITINEFVAYTRLSAIPLWNISYLQSIRK